MGSIKGSMKFEFFPKYFSLRKRGIIFHLWKFLSNSLLTHEHYKLVILEGMSTSFKPRKLLIRKLLFRVFSLIFGLLWFEINSLCLLFSWVIIELGKTITEARCITLEIANVLKIVNFPSRDKISHSPDFQNSLYFLKMIFEILFIFQVFVIIIVNSDNAFFYAA